ncbi:extracellular solute-binding protein [Streptomyces sp. NPDC056373]|uniref:extracellular solute-binding protein n=1 Tax=Streptomyces sp. NPDC056373 TaxID=3345798 RepID=UPI0035DE14AC
MTFVNAAGDTVYQKLRAAITSGDAPCLSKMDGMNLATFAADGLLTDITEVAAPYKPRYTVPAWNAVSPGGATYGIPTGSSPLFTAYRADLFQKYGIKAPTTWDDVIAAGRAAQKKNKNVKIFYMAGEDPSTLVDLSWQAGAQWYKIDGDHWVIDFTSPEALKAGDVVQQLIDGNLASNASYAAPGVFKTWDLGKTVLMTTSTWQLPGTHPADVPNLEPLVSTLTRPSEAARLDGAKEWRIAWSIKVPNITGILVMTGMFSLIGRLQLFYEPLFLRYVAPESIGTDFTPMLEIFDRAFKTGDYQYAAAESLVLAAITGILAFVFYRVTNRKMS